MLIYVITFVGFLVFVMNSIMFTPLCLGVPSSSSSLFVTPASTPRTSSRPNPFMCFDSVLSSRAGPPNVAEDFVGYGCGGVTALATLPSSVRNRWQRNAMARAAPAPVPTPVPTPGRTDTPSDWKSPSGDASGKDSGTDNATHATQVTDSATAVAVGIASVIHAPAATAAAIAPITADHVHDDTVIAEAPAANAAHAGFANDAAGATNSLSIHHGSAPRGCLYHGPLEVMDYAVKNTVNTVEVTNYAV